MVHENKRIADLPDVQPDFTDCTDALKTVDGTMRLFPLQSAALNMAASAGGGVFMLGCGVGKTLISLLLAPRLGCTRPLLLIPAALRAKTLAEAEKYRAHFVFEIPELLNYEQLSRKSGQNALTEIAPDVIICDEAHMLKDIASTRTQRLGAYLMDNPAVKLIVMSGTLFNKSIADFAHLSDWALEGLSPVPRNPRDVYMWDALLTGEAEPYMYGLFSPMSNKYGVNYAREAVFKRLNSAQGILLTTDETVPCSLSITRRNCKIPEQLKRAIQAAMALEMPMSEILEEFDIQDVDGITASQHLWSNPDTVALHTLAQLVCGMLYYWTWPENEVDEEWLNSRKSWRKAVRAVLDCGIDGVDSPELVFDKFPELPPEIQRAYGNSYTSWCANKDKAEPPRAVQWLSDYLVQDVRAWLQDQRQPALIWVDSIALGERLSKDLGIPYYGGGVEFNTEIAHNCVLSIASHGTGKNLQAWSNNLVVAAIASPQIWEQMLARTHRTGQLQDTVNVTVYSFSVFGSAFNNATKMAIVVGDTTGQRQRIVYADRLS